MLGLVMLVNAVGEEVELVELLVQGLQLLLYAKIFLMTSLNFYIYVIYSQISGTRNWLTFDQTTLHINFLQILNAQKRQTTFWKWQD